MVSKRDYNSCQICLKFSLCNLYHKVTVSSLFAHCQIFSLSLQSKGVDNAIPPVNLLDWALSLAFMFVSSSMISLTYDKVLL